MHSLVSESSRLIRVHPFCSTEGHKAYEETGKVSTFTTAFVDALREGDYKMVFGKVLESEFCVFMKSGIHSTGHIRGHSFCSSNLPRFKQSRKHYPF